MLAAGLRKEFPNDQKLKCYMRCLMTQLGVVSNEV